MNSNCLLSTIIIVIIFLLFRSKESFSGYDPSKDRLYRIVNSPPPGVEVEDPGLTWVL